MAAKKTLEEIDQARDPAKAVEPTEPNSDRITYTISPLDIVPMHRQLGEQAFLRELKIDIHWLGGLITQSWAVTVTGDPKKVGEFIDWGNTHRKDIETPKLV